MLTPEPEREPDDVLLGEVAVVHERSIYARISEWPPWSPFELRLHGFTFLRLFTALFFAVQIGLTIGLAVTGHYGLGAYTLWSFTMLTAYAGVLLAALFVQHWLLTAIVLYGMPIVLANTMDVCIAIVIILQNNFQLFIDGTKCDTPVPPNPTPLGTKHTGDWVEHNYTILATLVLAFVMKTFWRYIVVRSQWSFSPLGRWTYWAYWTFGPLLPLILYDLIFDVAKTYPTSFTWIERALILVGINVAWMTFMWVALHAVDKTKQFKHYVMPTRYDRQRRPGALENRDNVPLRLLRLDDTV